MVGIAQYLKQALSAIANNGIHTEDFIEESILATAKDMAKQRKRGAAQNTKLGKHPKKKPIVVRHESHDILNRGGGSYQVYLYIIQVAKHIRRLISFTGLDIQT